MRFDAQEVQRLVLGNAPESRALDYKRQFYGPKDNLELAKDITAFANTRGGQIIIGVAEGPTNHEVIGVDPEGCAKEIERMEQVLSARVDPRLRSLEYQPIEIDGKTVLVVQIEASPIAPHRVRDENRSYFYVRREKQAEAMDTNEIRHSFQSSQGIYDSARTFRRERVEVIANDEGARPLIGRLRFCIHAIPLAAADDYQFVYSNDFPEVVEWPYVNYTAHLTRSFSFEGAVYTLGSDDIPRSEYIQLSRNGAVEIVRSSDFNSPANMSADDLVGYFTISCLAALRLVYRYHRGEVAVMASLLGANGLTVSTRLHRRRPFEKRQYLLPETIASEVPDGIPEVRLILHQPLTVLFQAAGFGGIVSESELI